MIPPLLVLFTWPIVVCVLFSTLPRDRAVIWSILGGYLILPDSVSLDLPKLPKLDKEVIPALSAFIAATIIKGPPTQNDSNHILPGWRPRLNVLNLCIAATILGIVGTVLSNSDPIQFIGKAIPGLRIYDIFSLLPSTLLLLLPFLLGRKFLGNPESHQNVLIAFAVSGFAYSFLALYEIRMSPQINIKLYGYFQHEWIQHVRNGGFRPIVFLNHALWLSIFLSGSILSALVLARTLDSSRRTPFILMAGWMFVTLFLAKSLGAIALTLIAAPIVLFLSLRLQLILAASLAVIVLTYPMLRGADLVPVDRVASMAEAIDPARASSLQTRLDNEDLLLEKARERPVFGWGSWGRNRIYDAHGYDISITDGRWVITIGMAGWVGYIGQFGLLSLSILILWRKSKEYEMSLTTVGLALILSINLLDLIPNATLTPLTWLMAGALVGRLEFKRLSSTQESETVEAPTGLVYTRFKQKNASEEQPRTMAYRRDNYRRTQARRGSTT